MSNQTPIISIVMPLYNKAADVERAIKSVLLQTVSDFELIVVNDGSTDKGREVVRGIKDSRIKIIDQENAGVSAARNRGIKEATANLIAFLDADDEWESDFLKTIVHLSNRFSSCEVFATNYYFHGENSGTHPAIIRGLPYGFTEGILTDYFRIASRSNPPIFSSAVAVTRRAIEAVGCFSVGVVAGEDLLLWAKLAVQYDIAYTKEPKAYFNEPTEVFSRQQRAPDVPDIVGQELEAILITVQNNERKGLKSYIALWHRMRASRYICLGERRKALKEIRKAVRFAGLTPNLFIFLISTLLPKSLFIILSGLKRRIMR